MALGNDLDAKIDVIYNQYLSKQNDEKLADRVLTSKESFKEGLEEVIKINNIVDKTAFFDAILVEIKNGNFSISNDGKIDLNSESVNKAVIRAKEEEQKDREFRTVVETESKKDNLSEYKDLLEIKEVKSLEEAKRIVSMDVPNEVFDQIDPEVKKAAFKSVYEQMMDSERAEAMADIAVNPPKIDSYIEEPECDEIFSDKQYSKAFMGFYNTCFDDIKLIKKYEEACPELKRYDWDAPKQKKAGLAEIFATLYIAHEKNGMGEAFLEGYSKLSELTDEQRAAYKKLEPLYTRDDNIHDARLVTMMCETLKSFTGNWTKENLTYILRRNVKYSGNWELTPEVEAAIQEVVDNPQVFMDLADKTVDKKRQENKVNENAQTVIPKEFMEVHSQYLDGFDKNIFLGDQPVVMAKDNNRTVVDGALGQERYEMLTGVSKTTLKYNKYDLSSIMHRARDEIRDKGFPNDNPLLQQEGDEMDEGFEELIPDSFMNFVAQTRSEEIVVGEFRAIGDNGIHQTYNTTKEFTIFNKGSQFVHAEKTFDEDEFGDSNGTNHDNVTLKDKVKVVQEEKKSPGIQVEDIAIDEEPRNTINNENLPKKITWVDKVRASVDAFGKNVKKAFGSFISAITGKGGENNYGANNSTSSNSSNAGQNKPVQEVNNFVPTVELNLKQAQQATKAAEEAKKNNDARGTDEPTQDDSEIGE